MRHATSRAALARRAQRAERQVAVLDQRLRALRDRDVEQVRLLTEALLRELTRWRE